MKRMDVFRVRRGFTLMETLLAIALVGTLLSIFLTVFVPARGLVRQALTRQEAERITGVLRAEMSSLRADEEAPASAKSSSPTSFLSPFDKAFYWVRTSVRPSTSVVIFSYRADTSKPPRADGSFPPVAASKSVPGAHMQLVTVACPMNDRVHQNDIKDAVGPVFLVRMTQLVDRGDGVYRANRAPGVIGSASAPEGFVSDRDDAEAWGGVVFCRADFFLMSPPNPARYRTKTWRQMGRPLFSANLSFHR
ncbi:MAG: type II secretion system protein [Akkermansia sp.]